LWFESVGKGLKMIGSQPIHCESSERKRSGDQGWLRKEGIFTLPWWRPDH
jgi:hypothetical protein